MTLSRRFATVLLAALLAGCGSQPFTDQFPAAASPTRELVSVPFFPQQTRQCGAAALATVLVYRGLAVSPESLEPQLFTPGKGGTLAIDIVAQARNRGMLVYPVNPSLGDILAEVEAGNPVLVLQNLGLRWLSQWHFAVVVGFDLDKRQLILRSGNEQRHQVSMRTFLNTWDRADNWGVIIVPPGQVPVTAAAIPFLQAASALEQRHPSAAGQAYRLAWEKWRGDDDAEALARLGLFNVAYAGGQFAEAKAWLLRGRGPQTAAHWNNLAFCLSAMGCRQAAEFSSQCAIALEPDNPRYRQSLQELRVEPGGQGPAPPGDSCTVPTCPLDLSSGHSFR